MALRIERRINTARLHPGIVLSAGEDDCAVVVEGRRASVRYARPFPSPRAERVSPGHLVAVATAADGTQAVVWRWYDAVIIHYDKQNALVRLWEPSHGEIEARSRRPEQSRPLGTRAYLSAGLPGADWWVAGAAVAAAEDADVEFDEVERFCAAHDLLAELGWKAPPG